MVKIRGLVKDSITSATVQHVPFVVGDLTFAVDMAVTDMTENLMLGLDWLQQYGVQLHCGLNCVLVVADRQ